MKLITTKDTESLVAARIWADRLNMLDVIDMMYGTHFYGLSTVLLYIFVFAHISNVNCMHNTEKGGLMQNL